jgi:hypothetical protein
VKPTAQEILSVLDNCCDFFTFPMLDNGYVYLAATRLTVFRSAMDWAMAIEVFGFSPRSGLPDTHISTFASELQNRKRPGGYVSQVAYESYLDNHPHDESRFIYPVAGGNWLDGEFVAKVDPELTLRGESIWLPTVEDIKAHDIELRDQPNLRVFELCRYLADIRRSEVLATTDELRVNIGPDLMQILQLNEWNHPDVADDDCRPSSSETFRQLAEVMATGDARIYRPTLPPNTHWRNWPAGGTM